MEPDEGREIWLTIVGAAGLRDHPPPPGVPKSRLPISANALMFHPVYFAQAPVSRSRHKRRLQTLRPSAVTIAMLRATHFAATIARCLACDAWRFHSSSIARLTAANQGRRILVHRGRERHMPSIVAIADRRRRERRHSAPEAAIS